MDFELTNTEKKRPKKRQRKAKKANEVIEHIKVSVLLFLNAKATMTLLSEWFGGEFPEIFVLKTVDLVKDVNHE